MRQVGSCLAIAALTVGLLATQASAETEVRITWYDDGNEGLVLRDLLDRFEADNPDIKVTVDTVAYQAILDGLPVQLAAGEGPDIARVTDLGGLSKHYLDLSPYLSDTAYWEASFGPFLNYQIPSFGKLKEGAAQIKDNTFYQAPLAFESNGETDDQITASANYNTYSR